VRLNLEANRIETGVFEVRRCQHITCIVQEFNLIYWGEEHV
jgi:hypothetical protein